MNGHPAAPWRVVAASVAGTAHLEMGLPCQDAHAYRLLPGGVLLAAVSDGAGSAEHGLEGAQLAVAAALAGLEALCQGAAPDDEAGWQAALTGLFAEIHAHLAAQAAAAASPLQAWAATLTCALVTDDWLVVGQVGDGAAVAEDAGGVLFLAACPQRGEYANETHFLTALDADCHVAVYTRRGPAQALALTTDGLLRLALQLPAYAPHPLFFQPLLAFARQAAHDAEAQAELAEFLACERVCARSDDDKTLLLAVRTGAEMRPGTVKPGTEDEG